jgi:glycosyltransferase involved in cell wall biosynthesis
MSSDTKTDKLMHPLLQKSLRYTASYRATELPPTSGPPLPRSLGEAPLVDLSTVVSDTFTQIAEATRHPSIPLVSFITPFMNVNADVFYQTADSVFNCSFVNWEWVIINDGSEPAYTAALDHVVARDTVLHRVRVVHSSAYVHQLGVDASSGHVGLGAARQIGAWAAVAEYILFLDADDLLDPLAAEKFVWYLHMHPAAHFVSSFVQGFGAQDYQWEKGFNPSTPFREQNLAVATAMHRRASLLRVGHSLRRSGLEDWDTWLRYANASMWGATIREFLVYYRRRENHSDRWEAFTGTSMEAFAASIPDMYPRLGEHENWPKPPAVVATTFELTTPRLLDFGQRPRDGNTKNLLLIVPWIVLGGADRFNLELVKSLLGSGWRVTIVTTLPSNNNWAPQFTALTNDIIFLPNIAPSTSFLEIVHNLLISRSIHSVWISNSHYAYAMLPYLTVAHPSVVFVDYNHMEEEYWRNGGHVRHAVAMQSMLDRSLVSSQHLKEWMVQRGAEPDRVQVEYTSIDTNQWRRSNLARRDYRNRLGIPLGSLVILYACRIDKQKQPLLFAEVMHKLLAPRSFEHVHFIVGGSGPLEFELLAEFGRENEERRKNIHWVGSLAPNEMRDAIMASDIMFLPSLMEGIPLVFFEAMSLGSVIVGADVGGIRELVVHGETGFLVNVTDMPSTERTSTSIKRYVAHISELRDNPHLLSRMSAAAMARVAAFEQAPMFHRIDTMLRNMSEQKRAAAALAHASQGLVGHSPAILSALADTYRWAVRAEEGDHIRHV